RRGYVASIVTLLTTGRENPAIKLAHKRPHNVAGAFFASAMSCYGGCAWAGFGLAGCQLARVLTPRTVRHHLPRETGGGGAKTQVGASPMTPVPARNPSALPDRAAAHRGMAVAARRADSSLAVRLARYNRHMATARALEAEARQQQTTRTSDPRAALAWLQSGRPVRIEALSLREHQQHAEALAAVEALEVRRA